MKVFFVFCVALSIAMSANAQYIRPCASNLLSPLVAPGPVVASAPMVAPIVGSNAVATSLADTLSLLTVSSLLAEKLPLGYPLVAPSLGCGCNSPCGYPYVL
ncbi:uncharacterized protein LOC119836394 [Zerene cesonia]|uniref:uncharacterized protein LOC119836394 n=1 Tax=Zerene cesonia TaxID=33412 RepID=UPI0018E53C05|nr:uncharacterized protein LOC119836394 [Zerene cesonia]